MAIGGIFLMVSSMVLLQWSREVFNSRISDVDLGAELLNIDLDNLTFELDVLASNATKPEELKELLGIKTKEDALKLVFDYRTKTASLMKKSADIASGMASLNYLHAQTLSKFKISYLGIGLGLLSTILGFTLWYLRLQRYQDVLWKKGKYLS